MTKDLKDNKCLSRRVVELKVLTLIEARGKPELGRDSRTKREQLRTSMFILLRSLGFHFGIFNRLQQRVFLVSRLLSSSWPEEVLLSSSGVLNVKHRLF